MSNSSAPQFGTSTAHLIQEFDWKLYAPATALPPQYVDLIMTRVEMYANITRIDMTDAMEDDWSYATKKGKLYKRVKAALHKLNVPSLTAEHLLGYVDRYVRDNYMPPAYYRITRDLNWKSGDYGDAGTCFFSYYGYHRAAIVANEGGAALCRAVNIDGSIGKGIARCWLIPLAYGIGATNFYGFTNDQFSAILLNHYGDDYKVKPALVSAHTEYPGNDDHDEGMYNVTSYKNSMGFYLHHKEHTRRIVSGQEYHASATSCLCSVKQQGRNNGNAIPVPPSTYQGLRVCARCPFGEHQPEPVTMTMPMNL